MSKSIIAKIVETKVKILKAVGSTIMFATLLVLAMLMATG